MQKFVLMTAAIVMALPAVHAQPFKETFAKHWKLSGEFTVEVAKAMPADKYAFKPNDEEMDFGRVMVHIGLANNGNFALVSGMPNPTPQSIIATYKDPKGTFKKDDVVQFLTDSFAFCSKALDGSDAAKLSAMTGPEGRQLAGSERLWSYFTHTAHHRGQAEVYLRVNNIKPPDYRF